MSLHVKVSVLVISVRLIAGLCDLQFVHKSPTMLSHTFCRHCSAAVLGRGAAKHEGHTRCAVRRHQPEHATKVRFRAGPKGLSGSQMAAQLMQRQASPTVGAVVTGRRRRLLERTSTAAHAWGGLACRLSKCMHLRPDERRGVDHSAFVVSPPPLCPCAGCPAYGRLCILCHQFRWT